MHWWLADVAAPRRQAQAVRRDTCRPRCRPYSHDDLKALYAYLKTLTPTQSDEGLTRRTDSHLGLVFSALRAKSPDKEDKIPSSLHQLPDLRLHLAGVGADLGEDRH